MQTIGSESFSSKSLLPRTFPSFAVVSNEFWRLHQVGTSPASEESIDVSLAELAQIWPDFVKNWQHLPDWQSQMLCQSYLEDNASLGLHVSCQRYLQTDPRALSSLQRATVLALAAYELYRDIEGGQLEPCRERGLCLDMQAFKRIFGWNRLPGLKVDRHERDEDLQPFFILMVRGQMYPIGLKQSPEEIYTALAYCFEAQTLEPPLGLGTLLPRRQWAYWRQQLSRQAEVNQAHFRLINQSLFILCLEEDRPGKLEELVKFSRDRNFHNRYFDKGLQIFCFANGEAGFIYEHSMADGHPINRLARELYRRSLHVRAPSEFGSYPQALPCALRWQGVSETFLQVAKGFAQAGEKAMSQSFVIAYPLKRELFDKLELSADGVMQLAIQLVGANLSNSLLSTSEAIHMRHFFAGRYETLMSLSKASKDFIGAWQSLGASSAVLSHLLATASHQHRQAISAVKRGEGGLLLPRALLSHGRERGAEKAWRLLNPLVDPPLSTSSPLLGEGLAFASFTDGGDRIGVLYALSEEESCFAVRLQGAWEAEAKLLRALFFTVFDRLASLLTGMQKQRG